MKKFKVNRKSVKFEYEFNDGTSEKVEYLEPTTNQIDEAISIGEDVAERLAFTKNILRDCLKAGDESIVEKIIKEQTEYANIYDFKNTLDEELGKLKKSV